MKVCGLQKTTLLDFPGHVAATVFLGGCNFRCPFCHNSGLIGSEAKSEYSKEELLNFLSRRKGILEGVCITGGEPTLSEDLESFIRNIRELGYLIKLDTNGYRPDVLKRLAANGLLDYVAMDIKAGRDNYSAAAGVKDIKISEIEESAEFLLEGSVPYEFGKRNSQHTGFYGYRGMAGRLLPLLSAELCRFRTGPMFRLSAVFQGRTGSIFQCPETINSQCLAPWH